MQIKHKKNTIEAIAMQEGEVRPKSLTPKEFVGILRGVYANMPYLAARGIELIDEDDATVLRRNRSEHSNRLKGIVQGAMVISPDLSHHLKFYIERQVSLDAEFGVPSEPFPTSDSESGLHTIIAVDLAHSDDPGLSDEEVLRKLEIASFQNAQTYVDQLWRMVGVANKKSGENHPTAIGWGNVASKEEERMEDWKTYIIRGFGIDPDKLEQSTST